MHQNKSLMLSISNATVKIKPKKRKSLRVKQADQNFTPTIPEINKKKHLEQSQNIFLNFNNHEENPFPSINDLKKTNNELNLVKNSSEIIQLWNKLYENKRKHFFLDNFH